MNDNRNNVQPAQPAANGNAAGQVIQQALPPGGAGADGILGFQPYFRPQAFTVRVRLNVLSSRPNVLFYILSLAGNLYRCDDSIS